MYDPEKTMLTAKQANEIGRLPVEILKEIHKLLPCVKSARLTCKQWAAVGSHYLFRRVYFAPRCEVMNHFTAITQNKVFAHNIEELVYDARLFWARFEKINMYRTAMKRGLPTGFLADERLSGEEDRWKRNADWEAVGGSYVAKPDVGLGNTGKIPEIGACGLSLAAAGH